MFYHMYAVVVFFCLLSVTTVRTEYIFTQKQSHEDNKFFLTKKISFPTKSMALHAIPYFKNGEESHFRNPFQLSPIHHQKSLPAQQDAKSFVLCKTFTDLPNKDIKNLEFPQNDQEKYIFYQNKRKKSLTITNQTSFVGNVQ